MPRSELFNWEEIKDDFLGANLLLGNGFSINLHQRFHYNSLFACFLQNLDEDNRNIFNSFLTTNFEFILDELSTALKVNRIFSLENDSITAACDVLKTGLIKTVKENHPLKSDLDWDCLKLVSEKLSQFNNIFTINY